ncbi:isopeptide-forming domain-containing fimbrial protein [Enterococcus rotai]|uniref:isopeptide-forming domain-containing fimbrial protein n=1 Tax=Enterococcus rotai TaxID=118060 RepID=UPI0035C6701B
MRNSKTVKMIGIVLLLLSIIFVVTNNIRGTAIKASTKPTYKIEIVDPNYNNSGLLMVKIDISNMKKEHLMVSSVGTKGIGEENLFDGLNEKYNKKVRVEQKDSNKLDFFFTGEGGSFSETFFVSVDRESKAESGSLKLTSEDGEILSSVSFETMLEEDKEEIVDNSIQKRAISENLLAKADNIDMSNYSLTLPTPQNPVDVLDWEGLKAALNSKTIDWINLKNDIIATSAGPTVTTSKVINGLDGSVNRKINFQTRSITLGSASLGSSLVMVDTDVSLSRNTSAFSSSTANSGNWLLKINNVNFPEGNAGVLGSLVNGSVEMSGKNQFVTASNTGSVFIQTKALTITDAAVITGKFNAQFFTSAVEGSSLLINKGTKIDLTSGGSVPLIAITDQSVMEFSGVGTEVNLEAATTGGTSNDGVLILRTEAGTLPSEMKILDGATVNVHALSTGSAIGMTSLGGKFTVADNSNLNVTSEDSNGGGLQAVIRFALRGSNIFDVSNNSKVYIKKKAGNHSAIRMWSNNNEIIVSGGSDFILEHDGDGTERNPGTNGNNQGIQFREGSASETSSFKVLGEDSNVSLEADYGAAIDCNNQKLDVAVDEGAYFVVRGRTASASEGIFSSPGNTTTFTMTKPKYFDFRNDSSIGAMIFDNGASSKFTMTGSDLSVWNKGSLLDGNPSLSWTILDTVLSGTNFGTIDSTSNPDFKAKFAGANAYSRMTANNQSAIVDELRVPTDADKFIWGHASVPEGKGEANRDAYTDEVYLRVNVYKADGSLDFEAIGSSIGDDNGNGGESVYGDAPRAGIVKIQVPENKFLTKEHTIKVIGAWRGAKDAEGTGSVHTSLPEDLQAPDQTVLDVTPPEPAKLIDANLNNATKVLAGEGSEANATVYVYYENGDKDTGRLLGTTVVQADGKWVFDLPHYVDKDKELSIYLEDRAGKQSYDQKGLIKPPLTNTDNGNINPYNDYAYHDAVFNGVAKYQVKDILPDQPTLTKTVASSGGTTTTVGDTLTYTITAGNNKGDSFETNWKDVEITDVIPDGLMFDPLNPGITINGQPLTDASKFGYIPESKELWVKVGDLLSGTGKTPKNVVISFNVKVEVSAVGKKIYNTAKAAGTTPREQPFVPGINPNPTYEIKDITVKDSGTHTILGALLLKSAPESIDFGKFASNKNNNEIRIDEPKVNGDDLVISDTRNPTKEWELYVRMKEPFKNADAPTDPAYNLPDAIVYRKGNNETPITGISTPVLSNNNSNQGQIEYNVSAGWTKDGDGIKLRLPAGSVNKLGKYKGVLEFKIQDAK